MPCIRRLRYCTVQCMRHQFRAGVICATESWRVRLGGIEWGFQEWDAPEGVHPEAADSLLIIALKCSRRDLTAWLSSCPSINFSHKNRAGKTAEDVAREYGRTSWLTSVGEKNETLIIFPNSLFNPINFAQHRNKSGGGQKCYKRRRT